mmetsp:Transcript_8973/g.11017  ORF Transcript_8973/g.11017 Transcript_8973/m.11017 type:complete len:605 (+) Transcript_8973:15-1829(+)|eukprot:CAMPEP_0172485886 /NCGR_PEP_ID=MMETSP1066-20121228/14146_1 /TAXON_ID=671091 /ORGANISM="Coscinodiscus wailesii, Strain CCMP2513" /LENGTH=604 /DNA_ID=CAMNT_0013251439 /DNA_START=15 /DNA_END=1829 /DNA_ORIENTATION=-
MDRKNNETGYREHLLSTTEPPFPSSASLTLSHCNDTAAATALQQQQQQRPEEQNSERTLLHDNRDPTIQRHIHPLEITPNNDDDDVNDNHKDTFAVLPPQQQQHQQQHNEGFRSDKEIMEQLHTDRDRNNVPITTFVYIYVACAALNSANLGYDIGVNTDVAMLIQEDLELTDVELELFMGSLNLFAMVGALCAQYVTDRFGRRKSFVVSGFGFIIGIAIMALSHDYFTLMFGRTIIGFGVGFGLAIDPLYISEISPAPYRGMLVTWSEIATNIGIVLGFSSGLFFYTLPVNLAWRYMFAMGAILPAILIFLALRIMPESPRWLVSKGKEEKAMRVLESLYPPGYNVGLVVKDIKESIQVELERKHAVDWKIIFFPTPAVRRMLLVGVGMAVAQQAVGIDAIQYFLVFILEESGIEGRSQQATVLVLLGFLKLICIVISGLFFDSKGRRQMFFISLTGMIVALLTLALNFIIMQDSTLAVIGLGLYLSSFSLGMGPGAWLIPSEVFSTTIRARAMSMATFANRVTATIMASTFLTVANVMTWAGFFLFLAFVCVLVLVFVWFYLPETKGRSLEEMSRYFAELTGDETLLDLEKAVSDLSSLSRG